MELLTVSQAVGLSGISERSLRKHADAGRLTRHVQEDGTIRYDAEEIRRLRGLAETRPAEPCPRCPVLEAERDAARKQAARAEEEVAYLRNLLVESQRNAHEREAAWSRHLEGARAELAELRALPPARPWWKLWE